MALYTLIAYFLLFAVSLVIFKKISHPIVAFNLIWSFLILISMLSITGIYVPSSTVFKYFFIGGFVYNIVAFLFFMLDASISKNRYPHRGRQLISDQMRYAILLSVNLVMLVYYIYRTYLMIKNVGLYGEYAQIRRYYYSNDNFSSGLHYILVMYVFDPILYVDSIMASVNLFEKRYPRYFTVLLISNLILRMVISGGRMVLFEFGICILIYYMCVYRHSGKRRIKTFGERRRKRRISLLFIAIVVGAAVVTKLRNGAGQGIIDNVAYTLISNFTGSFSFFSILDWQNKYLSGFHGRVISAGIADIFYMAMHFFKISDAAIAQNSIGNMLNEFYIIGSHSYNAMPTMYYFFITDFGRKAGLIIGPSVLALYAFIADKKRRSRYTYKALAIYMLMMLAIVESPMTWLPFKTTFIMAHFFALLLVSGDYINRDED